MFTPEPRPALADQTDPQTLYKQDSLEDIPYVAEPSTQDKKLEEAHQTSTKKQMLLRGRT